MNRVAAWIATAVLLVAAALISQFAPPEDAEVAPFVVAGSPGDLLSGRDIAATTTDARLTRLLSDPTGWQAEGVWVVVDLEVMTLVGPPISMLDAAGAVRGAHLVIDSQTYRATERTDHSLLGARLFPGVARTGALAFELAAVPAPDSVLVLRLSLDVDSRADSVLEVSFPASSLADAPEITMPAVGWAQ